ncbi:MAG: hypothetical protein NVS9B4_00900 [Candidatus Acidiferrum sp.]
MVRGIAVTFEQRGCVEKIKRDAGRAGRRINRTASGEADQIRPCIRGAAAPHRARGGVFVILAGTAQCGVRREAPEWRSTSRASRIHGLLPIECDGYETERECVFEHGQGIKRAGAALLILG